MNEFGVDTSFATYLTQSHVDLLSFFIHRFAYTPANPSGTAAYFDITLTPDAACLPNMQLMQNSNKPAGMYLFSHAWNGQSAEFEATLCCDQLDAWGFTPDLGVFMDFERLGQTGRTGAYENLLYLGITPTPLLMQEIVSSWCRTIKRRGYKPGFYMNFDPIMAITNSWIQSNRFNTGLGEPYFWLAQWASTNSFDCDIWQYYAGEDGTGVQWEGIKVDYDKCMNDRIFGHTPSGNSDDFNIMMYLKPWWKKF